MGGHNGKNNCSNNMALIIGINYIGTSNELYGCINDTLTLGNYLQNNKYVNKDKIIFMNDRLDKNNECYPSADNIKNQLDKLIEYSWDFPDAKLFLSYSGHGHHIRDINGDEDDGWDEVLCPADFNNVGFITDDYLCLRLRGLNPECKMFVIIDACHSGTMLDLADSQIPAQITMLSGCRDDQTSADAYINNKHQGALTALFVKSMNDNITYKELMDNLYMYLVDGGYNQIPQLSTTYPLNLDEKVSITYFDDE